MRPGLLVVGACGGLLAGALVLSHVISTPEPVTLEETPPPPAVNVQAPMAAPQAVIAERLPPPPPGAQEMQRPEFDTADAVLADANASPGSLRDALGLFQRCVQYEPSNARCTASLRRAQERVAALPPEPIQAVVAQQPLVPLPAEPSMRKRDLNRLRAMPNFKNAQMIDRVKLRQLPEEK